MRFIAFLLVVFALGCSGSDGALFDANSEPLGSGGELSASDGTGGSGPVCAVGDTRECFGPGACRGAQTCVGDGWGQCDCGSAPDAEAGRGTGGATSADAGPPSGGSPGSGGQATGGVTTGTGGSGGPICPQGLEPCPYTDPPGQCQWPTNCVLLSHSTGGSPATGGAPGTGGIVQGTGGTPSCGPPSPSNGCGDPSCAPCRPDPSGRSIVCKQFANSSGEFKLSCAVQDLSGGYAPVWPNCDVNGNSTCLESSACAPSVPCCGSTQNLCGHCMQNGYCL